MVGAGLDELACPLRQSLIGGQHHAGSDAGQVVQGLQPLPARLQMLRGQQKRNGPRIGGTMCNPLKRLN